MKSDASTHESAVTTNIENSSQDHSRFRGGLTSKLVLFLYALAYGVAMMWFGGADFKHLYAPSPYHRLQADAILHGHLWIGNSIGQVGHDLAWHAGQVNQIWGIGIGLWLTPFEIVWRFFDAKWFPDRVALGVAFALLARYSWSLGRSLAAILEQPVAGMGFVWLIIFCPSVWAMNQGGRPVYEETSLYALLVSLGILTAVVRVGCLGLRRDFFICATLAGLSALVRPTHGIYGLAGILVCSVMLLMRRRFFKTVILGNVVFVAGLLILPVTNQSRFGSPTEFGHRLTITGDSVVYMTRFGNPLHQASIFEAGKEIFSWLFLNHRLRKTTDEEHLIHWQAPHARWRDPYMTTFDLGWALVTVAGFFGTLIWLWRKIHVGFKLSFFMGSPGSALLTGIFVWASISAGALVAFYLYFPNMSARYLLDFAPAFTGFALIVWMWISRRWQWIGLLALGVWLSYGILTVHIRPAPAALCTSAEISAELPRFTTTAFPDIQGGYNMTNHPRDMAFFGNGRGWNRENGKARAIVTVDLNAPQYVELIVGPGEYQKNVSRHDVYRAIMGGHFLPVQRIHTEADRTSVRFAVPEAIRRRADYELLFLCFTKNYDKEDRESRRILYSVRWR